MKFLNIILSIFILSTSMSVGNAQQKKMPYNPKADGELDVFPKSMEQS